MASKHRISVITRVKNCAPYLKESIQSILDQTFKDFEYLILDYNSTDGSSEIISSFTDPRIKHIKFDESIPFERAKAFNHGIARAKAPFIAIQDADDISLPERFEKQLEFLEKNIDVHILGTFVDITNKDGKIVDKLPLPITHEEIIEQLEFTAPIAQSTLMVRREVFEEYKYDEQMLFVEDYDLWLRICRGKKFRFHNLPESLFLYRKHDTNVTEEKRIRRFTYATMSRINLDKKPKDHISVKDAERILNRGCGKERRHFISNKYMEEFYRLPPSEIRKIYCLIIAVGLFPKFWVNEIKRRLRYY